jgi:hypothetical protein
MTDDLVRRLRANAAKWDHSVYREDSRRDREAADRIEELEAALREYENAILAIRKWVITGEVPK